MAYHERVERSMVVEDAKSRLRRVIGEEGVKNLAGRHVVLFGVGGVGGSCAEALVRGGVGKLTFIDGDEVQPSNLNRQAIAFQSTLGRRKVDVACAMARGIYPDVEVMGIDVFVLPEDLEGVMSDVGGRPDYIVDAIDTVATKLAIAHYAQREGIPLISSMGAANKTDPTKLAFADLFSTQSCPLCRAMRKQARAQGIEELRVLYSREVPAKPVLVDGAGADEAADRRACLGTMSYMPPIMGQMIAGYVIQGLLGK